MSSLQRQDILSLCHLRQDGRKQHEIRRIRCNLRPLTDSKAASLVQMGLTKVLVSVAGPMECPRRSDEKSDRANLSVSVSMAPFAGMSRLHTSTTNKRMLEMSSDIQNAFQAAVLLHLYPRSTIFVNVQILSDDGGVLECAINAVTLAMINAGVALKDLVCSCSAGMMNELSIIDLNRAEENESNNGNISKLSVAQMPQRSSVVLSKMSSRVSLTELGRLMEIVSSGCNAVYNVMAQCIRDHHANLIAARMGNAQISYNDPLNMVLDDT